MKIQPHPDGPALEPHFLTTRLNTLKPYHPALIYPLAVAGRVSMDEVRRIMGESAITHYTLEPPMKHVLCRASSLADVITKTHVLEKVQGVQSVTITLNQEVLVSTDLRHSLIREQIKKLENDR